jgi:hypothetical protein
MRSSGQHQASSASSSGGRAHGGATLWLYLTEPVTVVNAVNEGDLSPFLEQLGRVLIDAMRSILKYL